MVIKKSRKVQKSNQLNQANFSDFSLSCYRVLLNLISQIQRHDNNGNQLQLPVIARECTLSAKEYADEFNLTGNTAYEILKEATDKLMKTNFSMKIDKGILKINVCSQAHYVEKEGRIDIRFTEEIMPHLAELGQNFTMYNLKEVSQFSSIYTTRLYEILMQFKTTGTVDIAIDTLRFRLGCVNTLKQYTHLRQRAIDHAVQEINSQYQMNLAYCEIKSGRKVDRVIFKFKPTLVHLAYDPVKKRMRTQLIRPSRTQQPKP